MYRCHQLSFQYPNGPLFEYPDFELGQGKALLIQGASGSGKSTLLQLISGLRKPAAGSLTWKGESIPTWNNKRRSQTFGWIFQQMYFIPSLNVRDNILVPGTFQSIQSDQLEVQAESLGIKHLFDKQIQSCSRGEQQRISLLRALIANPEIILADEPTSSLDKSSCERLMHLMLDQCSKTGKTLIVVSHDERLSTLIDRRLTL